MREKHVWKVPVYGKREAQRKFLGIPLGTTVEKFVESYQEKVEERQSIVGGHRSAVTSLAFTHDGQLLASGSRDGTVRVWNVQSARETCAALHAQSGVVALAHVANRSVIVAALENRRLVLWDYGLHRQVVHVDAPDRAPLRAVAVSGDGHWIAAGGGGSRIFLWQTDHLTLAAEIGNTSGSVQALAFTSDGSGIVCGTSKGRVEMFDRGPGEARWSMRTGLGRIVALAVPPRAAGVVGGAADGTVAFWDLKSGEERKRVRPMRGRMASLAVTPDAALVLVGLASGKACLTDPGRGGEVAVLDGHAGPVTATAFTGTGKHAATGTTDGTVRLWILR
jgi:WD40 repeat protein